MRTRMIAMLLLLSGTCLAQFQFEDGPWYAVRVRDIAVGYKNGLSIIYAVNMSGGYFTTRTLVKSTDGGATWDHILSIQNPISVATQRSNPDIVIVSANGDLLRSTDGGGTWTVVYAGLIARRIAFSPSNPNIVLAGTYGPLNGHSLWVSADAGANWTSDNTFTDLTSITGIVFHPTPPACYISGVTNYSTAPSSGVWLGATLAGWGQILGGVANQQIAALAMQQDNPSVLYAGTIAEYGEQEPGKFKENAYVSQPPQIYKSIDGGTTWIPRGNFYASGIAIDPNNSFNVLVSSDQGMMRSTDAGANWFASVTGLYDRNLLTLTVDNSRGGAVLAGGFHSLYRSSNGGSTWTEQTHGIERPPVTGICVQDGRLIACSGRTKIGELYDVYIGTLHRRAKPQDPWTTVFTNSDPIDCNIYYWNDIKSPSINPGRSMLSVRSPAK